MCSCMLYFLWIGKDMSMHKQDDGPELSKALKDHGLATNTPSQLSDAFRLGWLAKTLAEKT